MEALHTAVTNWSDALQAQLGASRAAMTAARSNAQKIDTDGDNHLDDSDEYVDLWDLADQMAVQGIATAQANAVKNAVQQAVVRAAYRPGIPWVPVDYSNTHGLAIFWPQTTGGSYSAYVEDRIYNSTRDGTWDEFLVAYFGDEDRGGMPTDPGPGEREPATSWNFFLHLPFVVS